ncbi:MAG TPA: hypothetical protein VNL77_21315 [Roseiflexaceae bacterium]|nr:hypothetical protein [Roseiflexaceae bacterium]
MASSPTCAACAAGRRGDRDATTNDERRTTNDERRLLVSLRRWALGVGRWALGVGLASLVICLWASALPARAQEEAPNLQVEVQAGYGGAYHAGEWFPVQVTIANDGPDLRGTLELTFPGQRSEQTFRRAIDLPRGSSKRFTLDAFSRLFARNAQVRVLEGSAALVERTVTLTPVDQDRFLIGVVSSDPTLLNSLSALQLSGVSGVAVQHLPADALPEHAAALRGLNALFLHDVDTAQLPPAQREALALWVSLGGQLVVSGGLGGERAAAGIAPLLPVRVGGVGQGDLRPLEQLAGEPLTVPPDTATSAVQPLVGSQLIPPGAPLLYRWRYGVGAVTFSAFDLTALRGWPGEVALWGQVLQPITLFVPGASARVNQTSLLQDVLQLPALGLPSAGALLAFLLGYILIIGPLNYLVLRRIGRLEWAWLSVPLTVLVFSAGLYVVGFAGRGGASQLSQVAVVQAAEGQRRGFATAYVGLFSPRRASYTMGFPPGTLISETRGFDEAPSRDAAVVGGDEGVEVPDVLVDVGSVRTLVAEAPVDVVLGIQSSIRDEQGTVRGEIRYDGPLVLEHAMVVRGVTFQELGTLAPGASHLVDLDGAPRSFPWGVRLPESGLFNRRQLLNALFSGDSSRFAGAGAPTGALDAEGVYLLAWSAAPTLPVRVNGSQQQQSGLTLYIVRLSGV